MLGLKLLLHVSNRGPIKISKYSLRKLRHICNRNYFDRIALDSLKDKSTSQTSIA